MRSEFIDSVNKTIEMGHPTGEYKTSFIAQILELPLTGLERDKVQGIKDFAERNGWKTAFRKYDTLCSFKLNDIEPGETEAH